jgi:branched-chain amino acid transport system ATP-binding protein
LVSLDVPSLEMTGVTASYGSRKVLDNFHLTVARGELVSVLGHNGAGKTTALRVAAGLKAPTSGSVSMFGVKLDGVRTYARARMGMGFVPEGVSGLFPTLTIRQNLAAVRPAANENSAAWQTMEDHIRELFGEVLVNKVDNVAGSMSGGQRQMLAIAMALRRRPSLLLLDEPSTGLAPIVVERILRVVETLVKTTSASVVLVEQNFANALRVSSRTVIVQSGRVKAELTHDQFPEPTELWRYF